MLPTAQNPPPRHDTPLLGRNLLLRITTSINTVPNAQACHVSWQTVPGVLWLFIGCAPFTLYAVYFNISIWQVVEFYLVLSAHVADGAAACVSGVWPGGCSAEIDNTNIRNQIWACWVGQQRYFMGFPYSLWAMIFQRKYIISINLT